MKKFIIIGMSLLVANLLLTALSLSSVTKVAFVRSQELVYGYKGMEEMHTKFQAQTQVWQANIDTLKRDYQKARQQYEQMADRLSSQEKQNREHTLQVQEENMIQYAEMVNAKAREAEDKMLQGVLHQVNSFVEVYGRAKGYDIILGTTLSGSVLYGEEAIDITDELLMALNKNYINQLQ